MDQLDLLKLHLKELRATYRHLDKMDAYYEGNQPLRFMAPGLEEEVGLLCTQLVLNWPALTADAFDERSDIEGFRYKGESGDEQLWEMWQANDGDSQGQQANLESLINGRSFVIVGAGEAPGDPPVMTVEHPKQVGVLRDPKNRKVTSAVKAWTDLDNDGKKVDFATLYLPKARVTYVRRPHGWEVDSHDEHDFDVVPVVPLVNRGRILRQDGKSEFSSVIPMADAANKLATDMMISAEFHAMPRRWVVGMTAEDFVDREGKPLSSWKAVAGHMWGTDKAPSDVQFGQFQESDLSNFHNTIKLLAQLAAQVAYLPQDYLSFVSDNPSSADALRAHEARFVKRCERKHVAWGGGWEDVMRLMLRFDGDGSLDPKALRMETLWRDPSTPTVAQVADAVVKKVQAKLIPIEQAREDLGYTPEQRARMRQMDQEANATDPLGVLAQQFREPTPPPAPVAPVTPAPANGPA
jgi:Phage portal protein, SPP1 Gp6-like